MGYVGTIPLSGDYRKLDDISSGFNGSETAFTLQVGSANVTPPKETTVTISVGGILQEPVTAYTISGSTITFTAAPSAGADFFGVLLGDAMSIGTPSDDTVTGAKIVDDAINSEHYAAGSIDNEHIADGTIALAKTALTAGTGLTLTTNDLSVDAAQTQITSVGALNVGSITSGFTSIDVGAGAIAGGSLDVSEGNITNVGDISLDSISADATNISIAVTDNSATALTVLQGTDAYLIVDTANTSESVSIGTGVSGTAINIGHGTSETTFGDNVTITGDLTINGAQVTNATTNLTVADPLVKYGQAYVGSAYDQGFIVTRGNGSASNTQNMGFIWDESADEFATIKAATEDGATAGNVTVTDYVNLHVGAITADDASTFTSTISAATGSTIGNLTLANGSITDSSGAITFVNENLATTGTLAAGATTVTGKILVTDGANATIPTDGTYFWGDNSGTMHLSALGSVLVDLDTNNNGTTSSFAVRANATTTTAFKVYESGLSMIGDDSNANMTVGLTINQGANDDSILDFKSSDIAHGALGVAENVETDTYFAVKKRNSTVGGVSLSAYAEDGAEDEVMKFWAAGGTASTDKTTSGEGLFSFIAVEHDGSGNRANITADGNIFAVRAYVGGGFLTRLLVDEDGDTFIGGGYSFLGDDDTYMASGTANQIDWYVGGANDMRLTSAGHLHVEGDVYAYSSSIASDRKLKTNIVEIPKALDKVKALQGVTFDYKDKERGSSVGLIAQDVQEIYPELVKLAPVLNEGDESYQSLNYSGVIGLLVEAVKELAEKVGD